MTNDIYDLPLADDIIGGETNGDRIRHMSDNELSVLLFEAYLAGYDDLLHHDPFGEHYIWWTETFMKKPWEKPCESEVTQ